VKAPFRDSYILPQKLLSFTDNYPTTQGDLQIFASKLAEKRLFYAVFGISQRGKNRLGVISTGS
jgi:hypothetical protein